MALSLWVFLMAMMALCPSWYTRTAKGDKKNTMIFFVDTPGAPCYREGIMTPKTEKPTRYKFDPSVLTALRKRESLSMAQLGMKLRARGVGQLSAARTQVWNWEAGGYTPSSPMLRGLADVFGVPMESFFRQETE